MFIGTQLRLWLPTDHRPYLQWSAKASLTSWLRRSGGSLTRRRTVSQRLVLIALNAMTPSAEATDSHSCQYRIQAPASIKNMYHAPPEAARRGSERV